MSYTQENTVFSYIASVVQYLRHSGSMRTAKAKLNHLCSLALCVSTADCTSRCTCRVLTVSHVHQHFCTCTHEQYHLCQPELMPLLFRPSLCVVPGPKHLTHTYASTDYCCCHEQTLLCKIQCFHYLHYLFG